MTYEQWYSELNYVNHSREKRLYYAQLLLNNPSRIKIVMDILFQVNDKISCRAAWVLEFMCGRKIAELLPYLDEFTEKIPLVHLDSAVRPVAKICEYLAIARTGSATKMMISNTQRDRIIACCFDWLITPQKIAVRAYTMTTLYLFGLQKDWVHPELEHIINTKIIKESKGCKARGSKIIKLIKSNK